MTEQSAARPTRVAHVTTVHRATDNRILRKECVSLAEAGYEVYLLASAPEDGNVEGVRIKALPVFKSRLRRMVLGPLAALRALLRLRPDLVHVHDPELIPLAIAWRLLRRTPTVYDSHEDLAKQVMGKPYVKPWLRPVIVWFARALEVAADRFLDAIVSATPAIARNYRHAPVALVQNFPWARDFPRATPIDPDCRNVVYVGGIAEGRGALEMLEAVGRSKAGSRLLLAGPLMSSALPDEIARRSAAAEYLGHLPVSQVPAVIQSATIGLVLFHPLPNNLEAQPTKLFEYMAAGRPFIASDFPAWRRLLDDADCGVFVDPQDMDALRDAIDHLLTHPNETAAMGRRGRKAFEDRFSFESQVARLVDLVEHLLR
jgi:glycosyltransferase involved in cell wall biosynthesis